MPFPTQCTVSGSQKIVSLKENGRSFIIRNISGTRLTRVRFDGCVINNIPGQLSCDYGLWIENSSAAHFIELKGTDIKHACAQIAATIDFVKQNHADQMTGRSLHAAIVASAIKAPKLKQSSQYVKLRKLVSSPVEIKNGKLEIEV